MTLLVELGGAFNILTISYHASKMLGTSKPLKQPRIRIQLPGDMEGMVVSEQVRGLNKLARQVKALATRG